MRSLDEAMMNSNHDKKVFEWVTNLLIYLLIHYYEWCLTCGRDILCVDDWHLICGEWLLTCVRMKFDMWTNDIWHVDEWDLMREWTTFDGWTNDIWRVDEWHFMDGRIRMTFDMWTNDVSWLDEWHLMGGRMSCDVWTKTNRILTFCACRNILYMFWC